MQGMFANSASDVATALVFDDLELASSDRSSMVARIRLRISELESVRLRQRLADSKAARFRQRICELNSKLKSGVIIPVLDYSSSYATVSCAPLFLVGFDLSPGLAALPQVQLHDYRQSLLSPRVPIDNESNDSGDDDPLHINYTTAALRLSRIAPADFNGDLFSSLSLVGPSDTVNDLEGVRARRRPDRPYRL